jgi:hypothetical protein
VKSLIISFAVVCIVLAGCQQQTNITETAFYIQKAKSFIDSINLKFSAELRDGDSLALASHY